MPKRTYTDKSRKKVMKIFLSTKNNNTTVIARKTGFSKWFVGRTIDEHFKSKLASNNNG